MPIEYNCDDERRLMTVTVVGSCSVGDILSMIDVEAGENAWGCSLLCDLRRMTDVSPDADLQPILDRIKVRGAEPRRRVGIAIQPRPALFRLALMYTTLTKGFLTVEVLLTATQIDAWLARNAGRGSSDSR